VGGVQLSLASITRKDKMIETLVKPQTLDNDVAVIKILHLMGQLTPNDIEYVFKVSRQVYDAINLGETYGNNSKNY